MNDILRIIEKYKDQDGSPVNHPDLAQDIQLIQDMLDEAPEQDQETAKDFLRSIMSEVEKEIEAIKGQLSDKGETFEKVQKIADACLAYSKPSGGKG